MVIEPSQAEAVVLIPWTAKDHAETCYGLILLLRDVADMMHVEAEKDDHKVDTCDVGDWVSRLDFLLNVLVDSNDKMLEMLLRAGHRTLFQIGTTVVRGHLSGRDRSPD